MKRAVVIAIVVAGSGAAATSPAFGASQGAVHYGFTKAAKLGADIGVPYIPEAPDWNYNSTGGAITVTHNARGVYTVRMAGLAGTRGNVQIGTYGYTPPKCKLSSWASHNAAMVMHVHCYAPTGARANAKFVAEFIAADPDSGLPGGYLASSNAAAPVSVPIDAPSASSYNSTGGTNSIVRTGIGTYTVNIAGFTSDGGTAAVTALGLSKRWCKVAQWGTATVDIICFDPSGTPANSRFSLRYTDDATANLHAGAYLWANQPTTLSYSPEPAYSYNSTGQPIEATHLDYTSIGYGYLTGWYRVFFDGLPGFRATSAIATAYGTDPTYCNVGLWTGPLDGADSIGENGTEVTVLCRNKHGHLADSQFTLSYLTNR